MNKFEKWIDKYFGFNNRIPVIEDIDRQDHKILADFESLIESDNYLYSRIYNTPQGFYHGGDIRIAVDKKDVSTLFRVGFFKEGAWVSQMDFCIIDQICLKDIEPNWSYDRRYLCLGESTKEEIIFSYNKYMRGFK